MNKFVDNRFSIAKLTLVLASLSFTMVAQAVMPDINDARVQSLSERVIAAGNNPRRYAVPMEFSGEEALAEGSWQELAGGSLWTLPLAVAGAKNLSVGLAGLTMPEGGEIWLSGGGVSQGPYLPDGQSQLTAIVPGESAELLVRLPVGKQAGFNFSGLTLFYGFRSFTREATDNTTVNLTGSDEASGNRAGEPQKRAGSCLDSNDVACSVGNAWRDELRAVARITVGNVLFCSATLLNDTDQSLTPYLLTADHCGEDVGTDTSGFDDLDAVNTVAYWNFERGQCGPPDNGSLTQNQAGALLRARSLDIDFALLELQAAPMAAFNVHWAGWDASGRGASSGAGIHHPSGDEKKISIFSSSIRKQRPLSSLNTNDYWRVVWSDGVTEGGSSGSGLWNQDRRVVGSLSRGLSECRTVDNSANGSNPETDPDFYSAFDAAWNGNGSASGQLSAWLDSANTGVLTMNGRDAGAPAEPATDNGGDSGSGDGGGNSSSGGGGGGAMLWLMALLAAGSVRRLSA